MCSLNKQAKTPPMQRYSLGISLIELMVAMVIGIFLIGGVFAVFQSNQISYRTKMDMDNAQEAFRYMSYTLNRLTKSARRVHESSEPNVLVLTIEGGPGVQNCLGAPVAANTTQHNTFEVALGDLVCTVEGGGFGALVSGVQSIALTYGVDANADNRVSAAEYIAAGSVDEWNDVTSIMLEMTMASGLTTRFASSMRAQVTADLIVVRPDSPPSPPSGGGSSEEGGGENGGGDGSGGSNGGDNGSGGGNGDDSVGGGNGCTLVTITCSCYFQGQSFEVLSASDSRCTISMCSANSPSGLKNKDSFSFTTEVCQ